MRTKLLKLFFARYLSLFFVTKQVLSKHRHCRRFLVTGCPSRGHSMPEPREPDARAVGTRCPSRGDNDTKNAVQ